MFSKIFNLLYLNNNIYVLIFLIKDKFIYNKIISKIWININKINLINCKVSVFLINSLKKKKKDESFFKKKKNSSATNLSNI